MSDRGTRNANFVLRRLVERMIEKQKYVYVCFIDYSKAFDTVKHEPLIELQSLDIDPQYANTCKPIMDPTSGCKTHWRK